MRSAIAAVKERAPLTEHPYFRALADGSFTRDDFVETQIQFFSAVAFFRRPLAALAGRMEADEQKVVLENLADEYGRGDPKQSHAATFLQLLARLGVPGEEVPRRLAWPETVAFNTALAGTCALSPLRTALATVAMIEDLFAGISATIGRGIVGRGFLSADEVVHYATHEALDLDHAEGLYRLIEPAWSEDAAARDDIREGLELGALLLLGLYEGLYRQRARRWLRESDAA